MEYSFDLKVPKDRIAVIIGKDGETKKELEKDTKAMIMVDSKEGDIHIEGKDPLLAYVLREVIKSIAHGFSPEIARLLLKQDYILEIISLKDFAKANHHKRLKGRIIGAGGKSRTTIEDLTNCYVSVYGKNVSIIGEAETIDDAKRAVIMLLKGSTHATVYKFLEKQRKQKGTFF